MYNSAPFQALFQASFQESFLWFLDAGETLMHATSEITGDLERAIITTGYGPPMFPCKCMRRVWHSRIVQPIT
jgi:hypothetical protein